MSTDLMTIVSEKDYGAFISVKEMVPEANILTGNDGLPEMMINGNPVPLVGNEYQLMLVQSMSGTKMLEGKAGKLALCFEKDEDYEFYDELYAVPICVVSHAQRRFSEYGGQTRKGSDDALLCWSSGRFGLEPSAKVADSGKKPYCEKCCELSFKNGRVFRKPVCPEAEWQDGRPARCKYILTVAFLLMDGCIPVTMQLKSTALGAWNKFTSSRDRAADRARIRGNDLSKYGLRIGTKLNGNYYVPTFELTTLPEKYGDIKQYIQCAAYYRSELFSVFNENEPEVKKQEQVSQDVDVVDAEVVESEAFAEF